MGFLKSLKDTDFAQKKVLSGVETEFIST